MTNLKPIKWHAGDEPHGNDDGLSLVRLFTVLRRHKWMILAIVVLASAGTYGIASHLSPRYTAEAVIMIEPRKGQALDVKSGVPQVALDASTIRTEAEVLRSLDLANRVASKLNLVHEKEFGPKPDRVALLLEGCPDVASASLCKTVAGWAVAWGLVDPPADPAHPVRPGDPAASRTATPKLETVVERLQDNLNISNDGRSAIIKIRYDTADPKLGAAIVNAYATCYIEDQLAAKSAALDRAGTLLNQRVDELRETVLESDRAVQTFRDENQLTEARGSTVTAQQLAETNTQLTVAAAERTQKEANLKQLLAMNKSGDGPDGAVQLVNAPTILLLKGQLTEVARRQAELTARFGENHPLVRDVDNQARELRDRMARETRDIIAGLSNDVDAAQAREVALRQSLAELEGRAHELDKAQVHLHQLEREANANHELYEHFLTRAKETNVQKYFEEADARILSSALVPKNPTFPQVARLVELAALASLVFAFALAMLLEKFDHTFASVEDLERETDVLSFGMIPEISRGRGNPKMVIEHPTSAFSEAVRWVRTSLALVTSQRAKVVLVTSSMSREGKTTLSASLARSAAHSGQRVVLVDCDLRLGKIGKVFETQATRSLEAFIKGEADLADIISTDAATGLHYVTAALGAANPQALLSSERMALMLAEMRERYDLVVLDAPPVLAVSDALIIAKLADATIVAVRWNVTLRSGAIKALRELRKVGCNVVGVVLTRVDLRKNKANGFQSPEPYYFGSGQASAPAMPQHARVAEPG